MVSQKMLSELKLILERKFGRTFTAEEISEFGRRLVDYFELARKINKTKPLPTPSFSVFIRKFDGAKQLREIYKEMYGEVNNNK